MNNTELLQLIKSGEDIHTEFKKSSTEVTKDVYETVCSFSNRDGGHIFLGVNDNGEIIGIAKDYAEKIKTDFVTSVNNKDKIFPPLYLTPETMVIDDKLIIHIYVPVNNQVVRHRNRIYDRINDSDIDITEQPNAVYQLYARKNSSYFINKVTRFGLEALRPDLMERARMLARVNNAKHSWLTMNDEEMLRSAGLILTDDYTNQEGITLAGILLFGKDQTIMSALPQHKTDAILRVNNLDRYDDRDVIITNLLDSYERLIAFGQKHLNDPFVLEGIQRVSARDKILREVVSNSLAHRDYSSGFVSKFIIEANRIYLENPNRANGYGILQLSNFSPYPKNPAISKVFREIGLADELGSGMRNTYKYTKLYSGGVPEFCEGDMFKITIPLKQTTEQVTEQSTEQMTERTDGQKTELDTSKSNKQAASHTASQLTEQNSGRTDGQKTELNASKSNEQAASHTASQLTEQSTEQTTEQVIDKKTVADIEKAILIFCKNPKSRKEIQEYLGKTRTVLMDNYIRPLLEKGKLELTIPDKPKSQNQKYITKSVKRRKIK